MFFRCFSDKFSQNEIIISKIWESTIAIYSVYIEWCEVHKPRFSRKILSCEILRDFLFVFLSRMFVILLSLTTRKKNQFSPQSKHNMLF